mmetsp:Transcript_23096/g.48027  ORF Transcript_23096/g.48027 Transcript_23096/m.48027 type:complete len:401 (+) Transcript_23096:143-1345(+)
MSTKGLLIRLASNSLGLFGFLLHGDHSRARNALLQATQLSKAAQPADARIARIGPLTLQVVNHLVAVVGAEGDAPVVTPALPLSPLALLQHDEHNGVHVNVAIQVVGLDESAPSGAQPRLWCWRHHLPHVTEVHKVRAGGKLLAHGCDVVLWRRGVGANTQSDAVVLGVHCCQQSRHVVTRGASRLKAHDRPWGVIRMDAKVNACLLSDRHHRTEEVSQVLTHLLAGHVLVLSDCRTEVLQGIGLHHAPWQASNDVVLELLLGRVIHALKGCTSPLQGGWLIARLSTLPLQHEYVKCRQLISIVQQRLRAIREAVVQHRPRPIEHRHEVVADAAHAALAEVANALLVGLNVLGALWLTQLDCLVHGHGLHDRPGETIGLNQRLPRLDCLNGPDLTDRNIM